MNYGLYLSATGVLANMYRQDVIANNLANAETVGFKKDVPLFQQRLTAAQERRLGAHESNPLHERLGGGLVASPTAIDMSQGELESTDNPLDVAIIGKGYFAVNDGGQTRLTRDGRFLVNRQGHLVLANAQGQRLLDSRGRPIALEPGVPVEIADDGQIMQGGDPAARLGVFDVPRQDLLSKHGSGLLNHPHAQRLPAIQATLRTKFLERANVDPTTELAALMNVQRMLEANANMIRYQDQMLGKLVNEVGKIA